MSSANLQVIFDQNPSSFAGAVVPLLEKQEARNNLMLGLILGIVKKPPTEPFLLINIHKNLQLVGAAVQSSPFYSLILTDLEKPAIELLALTLAEKNLKIPGVIGPIDSAKYFSEVWSRLNFCQSEVAMETRFFELHKVIWPNKAAGQMKIANLGDQELILDWLEAFYFEAAPRDNWDRVEMTKRINNNISNKSYYLWIVGGKPASLAQLTRPTMNGICITSVFTPKDHRGHGYASNLVAYLSQHCLDEGYKFCCINTDASNPTSNRIYQNVGYQPLGSNINYIFR